MAEQSPAEVVATGEGGEDGEDGEGEEVVAEEIGGQPSNGQSLAAMEAAAEEATGGAPAPKRKPTAASQVALLVQALQNGDADSGCIGDARPVSSQCHGIGDMPT